MALIPLPSHYETHNGRIVQVTDWVDEYTGETDRTYEEVDNVPDEVSGQFGVNANMTADDNFSGQTFDMPARGGEIGPAPYGMGGGFRDSPAGMMPKSNMGQGQNGGPYGGGGMGVGDNPLLNKQPGQGPYQSPASGAGMAANSAAGQVNTNFQGGSGAPDAQTMRNMALYDPGNPLTALRNVLQDRGAIMSAGNPFVQMMERAAPGLALAFYAQNAMQAAQPNGAAPVQYDPSAFKSYLGNALGSGQVFSGLQQTARQLPEIVQQIRNTLTGGNTSIDQINPFVYLMDQMLGRNFGEGTTDALQALLGPTMPRSLAQAYDIGLGRSLSNAQRSHDFGNERALIYDQLFRTPGSTNAAMATQLGGPTGMTRGMGFG